MANDLLNKPYRYDFKIGVICALGLEADMVEMVFDKQWPPHRKAPTDDNTYKTGVIAGHNAVLAYCPNMGTNRAAQTARALMSSFTRIKIVFVIGICGAVPSYVSQDRVTRVNVSLGDCFISTGVIQLDLKRMGSDGSFPKNALESNIKIRSLISKLQTSRNIQKLTNGLRTHLRSLQRVCLETKYSGIDKNHDGAPSLHFGYFGSSNTVFKSGQYRDMLAKTENIIAFETEGAGVWEICPTIIIKAACDYADNHKDKKWQGYAAAVAATGLKAFLQELEFSKDEDMFVPKNPHFSGQENKLTGPSRRRPLSPFDGIDRDSDKVPLLVGNKSATESNAASIPDRIVITVTLCVCVVSAFMEGFSLAKTNPYMHTDFLLPDFFNSLQSSFMGLLSLVLTAYPLIRPPLCQTTTKWVHLFTVGGAIARISSTALLPFLGPGWSNFAGFLASACSAAVTVQLLESLKKSQKDDKYLYCRCGD